MSLHARVTGTCARSLACSAEQSAGDSGPSIASRLKLLNSTWTFRSCGRAEPPHEQAGDRETPSAAPHLCRAAMEPVMPRQPAPGHNSASTANAAQAQSLHPAPYRGDAVLQPEAAPESPGPSSRPPPRPWCASAQEELTRQGFELTAKALVVCPTCAAFRGTLRAVKVHHFRAHDAQLSSEGIARSMLRNQGLWPGLWGGRVVAEPPHAIARSAGPPTPARGMGAGTKRPFEDSRPLEAFAELARPWPGYLCRPVPVHVAQSLVGTSARNEASEPQTPVLLSGTPAGGTGARPLLISTLDPPAACPSAVRIRTDRGASTVMHALAGHDRLDYDAGLPPLCDRSPSPGPVPSPWPGSGHITPRESLTGMFGFVHGDCARGSQGGELKTLTPLPPAGAAPPCLAVSQGGQGTWDRAGGPLANVPSHDMLSPRPFPPLTPVADRAACMAGRSSPAGRPSTFGPWAPHKPCPVSVACATRPGRKARLLDRGGWPARREAAAARSPDLLQARDCWPTGQGMWVDVAIANVTHLPSPTPQ